MQLIWKKLQSKEKDVGKFGHPFKKFRFQLHAGLGDLGFVYTMIPLSLRNMLAVLRSVCRDFLRANNQPCQNRRPVLKTLMSDLGWTLGSRSIWRCSEALCQWRYNYE
jgi:hypothetical protein